MNLDEYSSLDGIGLAGLVRMREVSAIELAETGLAAIAKVNPQINAVIETYDVPADVTQPGDDAPFAGVPFLLKDIGSHDAGVKFELGSRLAAGTSRAAMGIGTCEPVSQQRCNCARAYKHSRDGVKLHNRARAIRADTQSVEPFTHCWRIVGRSSCCGRGGDGAYCPCQ